MKDFYLSKQCEYDDELKGLKARSRLYLYGKLLSFAAACVFIYIICTRESSWSVACAVLALDRKSVV